MGRCRPDDRRPPVVAAPQAGRDARPSRATCTACAASGSSSSTPAGHRVVTLRTRVVLVAVASAVAVLVLLLVPVTLLVRSNAADAAEQDADRGRPGRGRLPQHRRGPDRAPRGYVARINGRDDALPVTVVLADGTSSAPTSPAAPTPTPTATATGLPVATPTRTAVRAGWRRRPPPRSSTVDRRQVAAHRVAAGGGVGPGLRLRLRPQRDRAPSRSDCSCSAAPPLLVLASWRAWRRGGPADHPAARRDRRRPRTGWARATSRRGPATTARRRCAAWRPR